MGDWTIEYVDDGSQVGYDIFDPNDILLTSSRVNRENAPEEFETQAEAEALCEKYRQNKTYANFEE